MVYCIELEMHGKGYTLVGVVHAVKLRMNGKVESGPEHDHMQVLLVAYGASDKTQL